MERQGAHILFQFTSFFALYLLVEQATNDPLNIDLIFSDGLNYSTGVWLDPDFVIAWRD
jgi:hypothetical protein